MNIFDLVFIFSVLFVIIILLGLILAIITQRWQLLRRLAFGLGIYVGVYAFVLVAVALLSPQKVFKMHQLRCFDDWCVSVEMVEPQSSIGEIEANGTFYEVTLKVTSQAKRISQRAKDATVYLLDDHGVRYDISPEGQLALESIGLAGQPLTSMVEASGSFTYTAVFDLPLGIPAPGLVIAHGNFPGVIIIANDQSYLHKPTVIRLSIP